MMISSSFAGLEEEILRPRAQRGTVDSNDEDRMLKTELHYLPETKSRVVDSGIGEAAGLKGGNYNEGLLEATSASRDPVTKSKLPASRSAGQPADLVKSTDVGVSGSKLNQRGGRRGSQTTRGRLARGSIRNERMVARASALQKINRAQRTRQEQQNHMLSVSIENERALECEGFALPPMMVVNQPVERTFVAPQRSLVQPFARNRIPVEEEVPVPFVSPSGRRLTLHERFSHF
ncbi:hypothetical protein B566_EDAN012068 [Ephemera danica]|nr:hypothetical protein B566_EDAN012068 [Ephemera danica]